jgi:membrane protease subunit (stomatin/prohibitin family)/S-adenosylmethionine/arginine decarboxylase-like enzyme
MQDREIQNGGKLTVRDSQAAVFVNEGKVADAFGPGLYTLNTQTLPILTYLKNWDKAFKSPFKSDVYFFSTRIQTDQHWGTQNPITIRDKEFGAIRLRGFGIYSYRLSNAKSFYSKISGTRDIYRVADLEGQLRNTIIAKMTDAFAGSQVPFLDMAANQGVLAEKISETLKPSFMEYGLTLDSFVVENLSLPEELQKVLDQRISMNVLSDMGKFTQYQVAQAIPIAAGNEGGGAVGMGAGLGAGVAMGQAMMDAVKKSTSAPAGGRNSRCRDKILQRMWQTHPAQCQILPGMWKAPGVMPPPAMSGIEWVVEAFGCSSQSLRDLTVLQNLFKGIIGEMKLRPVGETQWHQFPGTGGITGLCLLAESHLACHTFPEHGSLCLNLFCCVRRAEWDFETVLRRLFGANSVSVRRLPRRYESRWKQVASD